MARQAIALMGVLAFRVAFALKGTPVQQVLEMLDKMMVKGKASMAEEKATFTEYTNWKNDRVTELSFEIKTSETNIQELIAFIEKAEQKVASLARSIAELDGEIAINSDAQKTATEQREKERADFVIAQEDLTGSVDALERAIQELKAASYDRPQAEAFLQHMAGKSHKMRKVLAMMQLMKASQKDDGAPAVAAYEAQTGGIIELLDKLLDKFKDQLSETETEEGNQKHAFQMEMLHLSDMQKRFETDREEQAALKGETAAESSAAQGRLSATKADLAEDKELLSNIQATYSVKAKVFQSNQDIRAQELEALSKAVEIISSPDVSGSYSKHVKLAQLAAQPTSIRRVPSLLQESSRSTLARRKEVAKAKAMELLQQRASALQSKVLIEAVQSLKANPFEKVIQMIESLLEKLKEEAASEASHKAFCDEELKKNKLKRNKLETEVGRLEAQVEQYAAEIEEMGATIKTLAQEQAELAKAMSEATAHRQKEKAENEAAIKDALAAQAAVSQAIQVLKEFYASQAALLQQKGGKQVPEMEAYKGMQGSKGGIVGMLEVIQSDFLRVETETKAAEGESASIYNSFMNESSASKKKKHEREVKLALDKDQAEFEKGRVEKTLRLTQEELDQANAYFETLKPQCLEVNVSFKERAARREEEIKALKEAYEILDGLSSE